VTLP